MTKNSSARATGAHISIIGRITGNELLATLDSVSIANGYANRFLWFIARRAQILRFGGSLDEETVVDLGKRTRAAVETARKVERVAVTADAREAWRRVYPAPAAFEAGMPSAADRALATWGEVEEERAAIIRASGPKVSLGSIPTGRLPTCP
jgi:hypothetical protein